MKKMMKIPLFCCALSLSSCFSFHAHLSKDSSAQFKKIEKQQAFVLNRSEFPREYQILKKSQLYALTDDSTVELKIRIHELKNAVTFRCLTAPATVMLFTLGQWPVLIPESYRFHFEEIKKGETIPFDYKIEVDRRIWFWDMFSWRKSLKREIALSLRMEKAKRNNQ